MGREAIDFRLSINGLALLVEKALGLNPFSACNRRRNRVKILGWDRNGFWLFLKRLEQDRFIWPTAEAVPALTVKQCRDAGRPRQAAMHLPGWSGRSADN